MEYPPNKKELELFIDIDIYKKTVIVVVNKTDEQVNELLRSIKPAVKDIEQSFVDLRLGSSNGKCLRLDGGGSSIIRLKSLGTEAEFRATLAHEVFHAVHAITDSVGLELSDSSEEAFAYLTGYITQEIYKNIK